VDASMPDLRVRPEKTRASRARGPKLNLTQ
jgi:hypothetical protein